MSVPAQTVAMETPAAQIPQVVIRAAVLLVTREMAIHVQVGNILRLSLTLHQTTKF